MTTARLTPNDLRLADQAVERAGSKRRSALTAAIAAKLADDDRFTSTMNSASVSAERRAKDIVARVFASTPSERAAAYTVLDRLEAELGISGAFRRYFE
jgi:hypothetical protein